jgi:glycerate 2-kinase
MKVLVIPDKFKGTLTARDAAEAIAAGWRKSRPRDHLVLLPMSDGGDGFGQVMGDFLDSRQQTVATHDAAHRPCKAHWWWQPKSGTAVIESATVIGLAMLPKEKFHPFDLDTSGLGAMFRAAIAKGAKQIIVGIGGSATNDGGFGLASALGWEFHDAHGNAITKWTDLQRLNKIRGTAAGIPTKRVKIIVASDVQNPLLGRHGASRVYGPQKGLRERDFVTAENCLRQLASVARKQLKKDFARMPGAGAAGGLGFGLAAFLGASFRSGFDLFAEASKLSRHLRSADLVITAEGSIDKSTLMGKGAGEVAMLCRKQKIPCIGLGGSVSRTPGLERLFKQVHALTDLTTLEKAKRHPNRWLEQLARQVAIGWRATVPVAARPTER